MDFLNVLQQLLPPGIALNAECVEVRDLLTKTAREFDAFAVLEEALFLETDSRLAKLILKEYELSLGLPNRCTIGLQTLAERRAAVYNKIMDRGGVRRTRYLDIAARLGHKDTTIDRFKLFTCESLCTDAVFSEQAWLFTWVINLYQHTEIQQFTTESFCSEPLQIWGNSMVECELNAEKPAYSILIFRYLTKE